MSPLLNPQVLQLWHSGMITNKLSPGTSYQLTRLIVHNYRSKNSLNMPNTGCCIKKIDDLQDVVQDTEVEETLHFLSQANIDGIANFEPTFLCICCKKTSVQPTTTPNIGKCENCETIQLFNKAKQRLTAKLFISANETTITLRAYEDSMKQIAQTEEITCETLLNAPSFNVA